MNNKVKIFIDTEINSSNERTIKEVYCFNEIIKEINNIKHLNKNKELVEEKMYKLNKINQDNSSYWSYQNVEIEK